MANKRMMKRTPLRWGIIGCGDVTEVKSGPAYQKTQGFELAAVARRDSEKVRDYAERHQVPKYYSEAQELIDDPDIDAIYVATPPDTHGYYAKKVAESGRPCCVEKPFAPSHEESLSILESFRSADQPLFVAYYRRSLPRFNKVKEWIDGHLIGDVRHINWHLRKPATDTDLSKQYIWRTDAGIATAGYFDDLACHGLDLFVYLLGRIEDAQGISLNQQGLYSARDAVSACWMHEGGATGSGSWNFGTRDRADKVEILGSAGSIEFAVFDGSPLRLESEDTVEELFIDNPENIQLPHVQNMREHLMGRSTHPSTGDTALHTAWVMDRILGRI